MHTKVTSKQSRSFVGTVTTFIRRHPILCSILLMFLLFWGLMWFFLFTPLPPYIHSRALIDAIHQGDLEKAEDILETHKDAVNTPEYIPSYLALMFECLPEYPLDYACMTGNADMVELLLNHGAEQVDGRYAACSAYFYTLREYHADDLKMVQRLLDAGFDPYFEGNAPLDSAASFLPQDANHEYDETMALQVTEIVRLLYEAGEREGRHEANTTYLLHFAVSRGNVALIEYLLNDVQMDVNKQLDHGETPLMRAVAPRWYNSVYNTNADEVIQTLLAHGADVTIRDHNGKTAYDYALESGAEDLAALIKPN